MDILGIIIQIKDQFSASLAKLNNQLTNVGKTFKGINEKIEPVANSLMTGIVLPSVAIGTIAVKNIMDFNKQMSLVGTLLTGDKVDPKRLEQLKVAVQDLAVSMKVSTDTITKGLFETISAFGDDEQTMERVRIATEAAVSGNTEVIESLKLLSSVSKSYNDKTSKNLTLISDLAFKANEIGQTTFPELAASIGEVSSFTSTLGINVRELFAVYGTLTGVTGNTSKVTTQFKAVLSNLITPTDAMQKKVKELGFSSIFAMVNQLKFKGTLDKLNESVGGNKEELAKLFSSTEALTAVFALTGNMANNFTDALKKMEDVDGSTKKAMDQMTDGINKSGMSWQKLIVSLQVLSQKIGDLLLPLFTKIVANVQKIVDWFSNLSDASKKNIISFVGFAVAATTLFFGITKIVAAVGTLSTAFTGLSSILPFAGAIAGIALLITGIVALYKHFNDLSGKMEKLQDESNKFKSAYETYSNAVKDLTKNIDGLTESQKQLQKAQVDVYKFQVLKSLQDQIKLYKETEKVSMTKRKDLLSAQNQLNMYGAEYDPKSKTTNYYAYSTGMNGERIKSRISAGFYMKTMESLQNKINTNNLELNKFELLKSEMYSNIEKLQTDNLMQKEELKRSIGGYYYDLITGSFKSANDLNTNRLIQEQKTQNDLSKKQNDLTQQLIETTQESKFDNFKLLSEMMNKFTTVRLINENLFGLTRTGGR